MVSLCCGMWILRVCRATRFIHVFTGVLQDIEQRMRPVWSAFNAMSYLLLLPAAAWSPSQCCIQASSVVICPAGLIPW